MSRPLITTIAALALTACVDNNADSGLTILRNLAPATGCEITADSTSFRGSGLIDTGASSGYLFTPVARNDLLIADGESATARTIFVEGAHVTVGFFDDKLFTAAERDTFTTDGVTRFAIPTSGALDPGGGTATFNFEIVPVELLEAIGAKLPVGGSTLLNVSVQIYGSRTGSTVESNVFKYPVEVCKDCLKRNLGACATLPSNFEADPGGACNLLQDGALDCCMNGAIEVCPATPTDPPKT